MDESSAEFAGGANVRGASAPDKWVHKPGHDHAVSWAAVMAGAAGAAALSLILLVLGTGLGLSTVSPWVQQGVSAATFGISTIVWITFTQIAASGLGGYLAGRLRSRWADAQSDEVYFRDTAHGFLAWAIATLATAALLTSAIGSVLGTGAKAATGLAAGGATATAAAGAGAGAGAAKQLPGRSDDDGKQASSYFVDSLFRPGVAVDGTVAPVGKPAGQATDAAPGNAEASAIVANGLRAGALPQDDAAYLAQSITERTGMNRQDADKRVTDTFALMQTKARDAEAAARDAADKARKASAYAALWLFVSLLAGAFCSSFAATFGGRQRDLP